MGNKSSYTSQNLVIENDSTQQTKSTESTQSNDYDWEKKDFVSTNEFSLNKQYLKCRVVDIYDGDTCTCVLPLFGEFFKFTIRLAEIDTCEMKSKSNTNKELALKARMCLFDLITNDSYKNKNLDLNISRKDMREKLNTNVYLIHILCGEFDKYGRLLGWLFPLAEINDPNDPSTDIIQKKSFNHLLIKEGVAYYYKGDTKLSEIEQIEIFQNVK